MSERDIIRTAVRVADKLAQVKMKHNFILLQKVTLDDADDKFNLIPENMKEFRLKVVSIGPGSMLANEDGKWERAPMSVELGDLVQFAGAMLAIKIGEEDMAVIQDTQVFLTVSDYTVH